MLSIEDIPVRSAIAAIDNGRIDELSELIAKHPGLVKERLNNNREGYFKDPYLLWFVADNPIRVNELPPNILEITNLLVQAVKREAPDSFQLQINYALSLTASGRIVRECRVQTQIIDLLIAAGASPGGSAMAALANGNTEAAQHLLDRGDQPTLATAVCLERLDDVNHLIGQAGNAEKLTALTAAAFYGKENMVKRLLETGTDPNGFPENNSGFHSHATPLHQAVSSGSISCVKLLVEAGARLDIPDKIYNGTPLGWAIHMRSDDAGDGMKKKNFALIEAYLKTLE